MRIGLDGDTLGRKRTGDESYLASLMRGFGRVDGANEYLVFVRDAETVSSQFPELPRFRFETVSPGSIWLRHPIGLPLALRRSSLDLLHVQYFLPPFTRCPTVVTVHDISFAARPELFTLRDQILLNALVPPALRRATRVITDTEYTRRDMVSIYQLDPARIDVIPLAADPRYRPLDREACRTRIGEQHAVDGGFILYVGTFQPRKNVATLIRAYGLLRERTGLPHKLLIVGKPKYKFEDVLTAIRDSGYESDILFAGFVPDDELPVYYNAADLFVFPSRYEGFGLPVLEAMACGTPVVSSNASCLPEVAGNGALLVDPDDVEGFAQAMERVLADNAGPDMRERGLRRAAEFSWDRTARETLAVYERVLRETHVN